MHASSGRVCAAICAAIITRRRFGCRRHQSFWYTGALRRCARAHCQRGDRVGRGWSGEDVVGANRVVHAHAWRQRRWMLLAGALLRAVVGWTMGKDRATIGRAGRAVAEALGVAGVTRTGGSGGER